MPKAETKRRLKALRVDTNRNPTPYTLHPAPYTLPPKPLTLSPLPHQPSALPCEGLVDALSGFLLTCSLLGYRLLDAEGRDEEAVEGSCRVSREHLA